MADSQSACEIYALLNDSGPKRLLDALPDIVIVIDPEGNVQWANRAAERLFGRSLSDSLGMSGLELVHPEDLNFVLLSLGTIQAKEVGAPIELRLLTPCGWRLMELIGAPVPWLQDGAIVLSLRDLTDRRRYELAHDHVGRFRTLVQSAATLTMLVTPNGIIESCSGALTRVLGHDSDLVEGRHLGVLVIDEDQPQLHAALRQASRGADTAHPVTVTVSLRRRKDEVPVSFELAFVNLVDDPTVGGYVVYGHDVTDRRRLEAQLEYQAFHDTLTGLGNRALFQDRLEQAIKRSERTQDRVALLFLDLDSFKIVNDVYGHAIGDAVLRKTAASLSVCLRDYDTAARLGGDEFAIIAEGLVDPGEAMGLADRIRSACGQPMAIGSVTLTPTVSVGVALSERCGPVEDLMHNADRAMYLAKDRGKNRCVQFEAGN
jgi:diguanylate cyclase (GGDEF)-like protein/PAS domain S-box-containing protein